MHSLTLSYNTVNNVNARFQKFKLETPIMKEISNIKRGRGESMPEFIPGDC